MAYGDSKATSYTEELLASLNAIPLYATVTAESDDLMIGGTTITAMADRVAADMAARPTADGMSYQHILITVGANDVSALPSEADWKADLGTVLDTINAKFPSANVYVALPWRRGYATECDTLATWIAAVLVPRAAWASVGPDERVYLENGDDGVTYTSDGVHPNAAGQIVAAAQWQTVIGY